MKSLVLMITALVTLVNAGMDCPTPHLENGVVTGSSTGDMFVGKFQCNAGFLLVGNSVIKCRQGTWTNHIPICTQIGTCAKLPEIPNGSKILVEGSRGSMFRIKCRAGFLRLGARRLYCAGTQWSAELPVCAKTTCDARNMASIEGGHTDKVMGGAMFRYRCTEGANMIGSPVVYCDGIKWNGTVPTCLGVSGPVKVQTWVDGLATNNVKMGDFVTVTCSADGDFPAPRITIFKNFELVADSDVMRKRYFTFTATVRDNNADIACFSKNDAAKEPRESHTKLKVNFLPEKIMVGGLIQLKRQNVYNYVCRSEAASPPPSLVWSVINYRGEIKDVVIAKEDVINVGEGWESVSSIELQTSEDEGDITITCIASNTVGRVSHTVHVRTEYMPETVSILGPPSMSYNEESIMTCITSASYPAPSLMWKLIKVKNAEMDEEKLVEGDVITEVTEEGGVSAKSVLKVHNVGKDVDNILVHCVARVAGMGDIQAEVLKVEITASPGQPNITGIQSGSSVPEASYHVLTCSALAGKPSATVVWYKDGVVIQGVDWQLQGGKVMSQWGYRAKIGDGEIGCMVSNAVAKKPLMTSIYVNVVKSEIETVDEPTEKLEIVKHGEAVALQSEKETEEYTIIEVIDTNEKANEDENFEKSTHSIWSFENEIEVTDENIDHQKIGESTLIEDKSMIEEEKINNSRSKKDEETVEQIRRLNEIGVTNKHSDQQKTGESMVNENEKVIGEDVIKNTKNEMEVQKEDDIGENLDIITSLKNEKKHEQTMYEIENEIEVTKKTIDYQQDTKVKEGMFTSKIRWIEAPIEVTEGYYKLYIDEYDSDDEEDDDDEPIRPQKEIRVADINQKTSKRLNAEIKLRSLIVSANSSPVFNSSLLTIFLSIVLVLHFNNLN